MTHTLRQTFSLFRPQDRTLSSETQWQVQVHRALSLLAALLIPAFGALSSARGPLSVDPAWARLGMAGLFAALLVASFWLQRVRQYYVRWMRVLVYLLVSWTILLAIVNHFAGDYVAGLLLVYAAVIVVVGIGARTIRPVLMLAAFGVVATALGALGTVAPYTSPVVLLASMSTVAIVESVAISAYLSTRRQLEERDRRLQGVANSVPGVVFQFVARPDGCHTNNFVSDQAESLLGIPSEAEDFYDRFVEHVPASHRDQLVESIDIAIEMEERWQFEMPFDRPDGERLWLLGTSTPERRGDTLVFNGVLYDITQRRDAEQGVRDRERKTDALYSAAKKLLTARSSEEVAARLERMVRGTFGYPLTAVHFVHDGRLEPVEVSSHGSIGGEEIPSFALDGNSVAGRVIRSGEPIVVDDLQEESRFDYEHLRAVACMPIGEHGVVSILSADVGAIEPFDVRLVEILAAYAAAVLDRLDRERELVAAKEEAEQANELKTAMLANMSHEIRTPLTSIVGFAEVLTEDLNGEQNRAAEKIFAGGQRLLDTLDSVLRLSSLEAGATDLAREPVCLDEVVEETVNLFRPMAREKSLTLSTEGPDVRARGYWDEAAVRRVTEHLLENALKFTPTGGRVTIRVRQDRSVGVLEIEDTGIGMPVDEVSTFFQPFKQESVGLGREYEGTGLGLSIVERLVEMQGGSVSVQTEKGVGSCFTVRLPHRTPETTV